MLYHRNGPGPRASHKKKQEEEGLGWKSKIIQSVTTAKVIQF